MHVFHPMTVQQAHALASGDSNTAFLVGVILHLLFRYLYITRIIGSGALPVPENTVSTLPASPQSVRFPVVNNCTPTVSYTHRTIGRF